jgi:excisionase family DNA binding protein
MTRLTDVMTVKEAAAFKGVVEGTVRRRIERGRLPATKKGDIWLIKRKDLDEWNPRRKYGPPLSPIAVDGNRMTLADTWGGKGRVEIEFVGDNSDCQELKGGRLQEKEE